MSLILCEKCKSKYSNILRACPKCNKATDSKFLMPTDIDHDEITKQTCVECGVQVDKFVETCPNCKSPMVYKHGNVIGQNNIKSAIYKARCYECEENYDEGFDQCPNCGMPRDFADYMNERKEVDLRLKQNIATEKQRVEAEKGKKLKLAQDAASSLEVFTKLIIKFFITLIFLIIFVCLAMTGVGVIGGFFFAVIYFRVIDSF